MASMCIGCGFENRAIHYEHQGIRLSADRKSSRPDRISPLRRASLRKGPRISATSTANPSVSAPCYANPGSDRTGSLFPEKLDQWIRDSAVEIVKNLREAPLLLRVYANDNGAAKRLETEKAISEDWPRVSRRWKDGETTPPDGLILVEELGGEEDLGEENGTRAWGIVVQGKGAERGPACYLMKTSRVGSGFGSGSTHFCLKKVQSFRESAQSQLTNCWLLE